MATYLNKRAFSLLFLSGLVFLALSTSPSESLAVEPTPGPLFVYEGILSNSSGEPFTNTQTVTFQIIYSTSCIVYEEEHTITTGSLGEFSVTLGTGIRKDSTTNSAKHIFASSGTIECSGNSPVTVTGGMSRRLHIRVGSVDLLPDVEINPVPVALNSERLQDKNASDFIQVSPSITQTKLEDTFSRYNALDKALNIFSQTPTAGMILMGNGTEFSPAMLLATSGITVTPNASNLTIGLTSSGVTAGIYGSATAVPKITVDAFGRLTAVVNETITGAAPTGPAGGDLDGAYPNPTLKSDSVKSTHIAANAVGNLQLANNSITNEKINSVDASKITTGVLPTSHGGTNSSATLNNGRLMISSGSAIVEHAALPANKVLVTDANGLPTAAAITSTELSKLSSLPNNIQAQIDSKANSGGYAILSLIGTNNAGQMNSVSGTVNGSILQQTSAGPAFSNAVYPASTSANALLYSSINNNVTELNPQANSFLVSDNDGVPKWQPANSDHFNQYLFLAGRGGGQILHGGQAPFDNLTINSTTSTNKGDILLNPNGGKVGIGTNTPVATLDVAGEIKFGNTTAGQACNVQHEGKQRYSSSSKRMEYCDGSVWVSIGGRAACPSGFVLVGEPGSLDAFCISSNAESPNTWINAAKACSSKSPKARLCSSAEWLAACVEKTGTPGNNFGSTSDWITDFASFQDTTNYLDPRVMGGQGVDQCNVGGHFDSNLNKNYRCCLR